MAWRYPKYPITPNSVLDVDPINENFLVVAGEVSGNLNEHNLSTADLNLTRAQMADDAAFRLHTSVPSPLPLVKVTDDKVNWKSIESIDSWQTFPGPGSTLSFVAKGGTVWLCASFNVYNNYPNPSFSNIPGLQKGFGYNFALRLDGVILHETLLGAGDPTNEVYSSMPMVITGAVLDSFPQGGGGISGTQLPVVVDTVLELLPGAHTLELAIQNIRGSMRASETDLITYLTTREMFVLEMLS